MYASLSICKILHTTKFFGRLQLIESLLSDFDTLINQLFLIEVSRIRKC